MIEIRPAAERGHASHGWLSSWHTFSFADYHDPAHMGFRSLRVINDDIVQPGEGFGMHPHRDMEILTYILEGSLEHRDSMGTGSVINAGDLQRMSAGTGVLHSEFNASDAKPVHFLQIWIHPERNGLDPSYDERRASDDDVSAGALLLAAHEPADGSVAIHQDARVFALRIDAGQSLEHALKPGRYVWVHVISGPVKLNGQTLDAGDGAGVSEEASLLFEAEAPAHLLLFDLA